MLLRVVHEAGVEVRLICLIVVGIRNIVYSAVQTEQHTAHAQAPDIRYPRRHKLRAFRLVREYPAQHHIYRSCGVVPRYKLDLRRQLLDAE